MKDTYRGILIDQSVEDPDEILLHTTVSGKRETTLEGESFRGKVLFYNLEVEEEHLQTVLRLVADQLKSPGWYFHLVGNELLYVIMPHKVMSAHNNEVELKEIVDYATDHGIHRDQLNLKQLFTNPFA